VLDHFRRRALRRLGLQCVAAEEVDLLQLREQRRARRAAGHALHLVHRQRFVDVDARGIELGAREVPRDHQHVALHLLLARGPEPIRPAALHQLDELVIVRGQEALERLALVGRVDRDRANGGLPRMGGQAHGEASSG
jgi:hypothetical protein